MAALEQLLADLTSGDDARAAAALPALTVHGDAALEGLLALLQAPLADHRWWACRALAAFASPLARSALLAALHDPAIGVRQCAALALCHNPSPEAVPQLMGLLDDDDRLLARLASCALAAVGQPAVAALSQAAFEASPTARIEAVRALAAIDHPEVIGPLFALIDDPSSLVRHWAEEGLDRLGLGMAFFPP